ncbi:MAG: hypothetical protein E6K80_07530 [Candidatus Eisenbacteria bacterium]|uniref:Uncharacterized protein n=1 Tax=Eiseniibacteriota bacterium TaxID=2212470 RepID=A0A538U4C3_UNCEI|nr:MAG: hypothetical protein E6K80_07530 [Candidatus Eisenbacteria bacterium]
MTREGRKETLSLVDAAEFLLEECRMVLPGMQALFGFQLIAVFSPSFSERLSAGEQRLHLIAIGLVALAVAIIMTPAAAHRQISAETMSRAFIMVATRLLLWSMLPLALGICLDFDLVGRLILGRGVLTTVLAAALFLVFVTLWFLLPRMRSVRETLALEE